DIALDIAARSERGEQAIVDAADGALEVAHQYAVELDALPRGEAERAVGVLAGQFVDGQVLLTGDLPAGDLAADHEHVRLAGPLFAACFSRVAVLLLVGPVELQEAFVGVAEMIDLGGDLVADRAAQMLAGFLLQLDGGALRLPGLGVMAHRDSFAARYLTG